MTRDKALELAIELLDREIWKLAQTRSAELLKRRAALLKASSILAEMLFELEDRADFRERGDDK